MWGPFVVDECSYLVKCTQISDVKIYITDFKSIWVESISTEDLIARFQELNPLVDASSLSAEDILNKIVSLINDIHLETVVALTKENDRIILELKRKLPEFFVRCKFYLHAGDENMFFNEFTIALIQSVQYLEVRQKKLFDLLEKKDKEIQEHQLEGGEISRKSLVTKKFDRNALLERAPEQLFVNVFGKSKLFLETFTKKYGAIVNTTAKEKTEIAECKPRKKFKGDQPRL